MAKVLTARAVEALKPDAAGKRREVPDGLLPGLYLVIQPSGAKSWAFRYRFVGKPKKLTLGPLAPKLDGAEPEPVLDAPLTLAGARQLAREALHQIAAGQDPATAKKLEKHAARDPEIIERDLFETVARQFIERYARPKNRRWIETARLLGLIPDPGRAVDEDGNEIAIEKRPLVLRKEGPAAVWKGRRIQDIDRRDVIEHLDEIVDRGAPVLANRTLGALRRLFSWAVERAILPASPCAGVKPPGVEKSRDRILSDDEVCGLWRACDRLGYPFGPLVKLLLLTGQRRNEVADMTWRELDLDGRLWTIPAARSKNGIAHTVPLSDAALDILRKVPRIKGCPYVFSTTGAKPVAGFSGAKDRLDHLLLEAARNAAMERGADPTAVEPWPRWTMHDLRRTVASGMARLGINLPVIEKVLNHISGSFAGVAGIYQRHSFADEKRAALDAWAPFVLQVTEDRQAGNVVALRA